MTQPTPTQDLVAKDLHGYEWRFKHIFRGTNVTCGHHFTFLSFLVLSMTPVSSSWMEKLFILCYDENMHIPFNPCWSSKFLVARSTEETLTYNWMEYICHFKEIGCR